MSYIPLPPGLGTFLAQVRTKLMLDPEFLDNPDCPYDVEVCRILKRAFLPGEPAAAVDVFEGRDEFDVILQEIQGTISEMKSLESTLGDSEVSDRIQFVKAKTALLERWSAQKEKVWNLRSMVQFQQTVVQFMEDVLSDFKDQRTEFVRRMRDLKTARDLKIN